MKTSIRSSLLAVAFAAGCATTGGPEAGDPTEAPPPPFTKIDTKSIWLAPAELWQMKLDTVVVALVDLDFSKPETELELNTASFHPDGNVMRLAVVGAPARAKTIAELRDALAARTTEGPIGLVVTAGRQPLGAGTEISPEMQAFLKYFLEQLDAAGVKYTVLAPEKLTVTWP